MFLIDNQSIMKNGKAKNREAKSLFDGQNSKHAVEYAEADVVAGKSEAVFARRVVLILRAGVLGEYLAQRRYLLLVK